MAAIQPGIPFESATVIARGEPVSLQVRIVCSALALVCAIGGLLLAGHYPILPALALVVVVGWCAFAFLRFPIALPAMLALIPVVGFASWTGWLTFEEVDMLVLASAAGGYASLAWRGAARIDRSVRRFSPGLSIFSIALIAVFVVACVVSLLRAFDAAGGFRFDWFQGYNDPLNGLRVFKPVAWAVLMAPLLLVEVRKPGFFDRLGLGVTVALGLCSLGVLEERLAFTGLLDFSDDYRVTGLFWEMHVGGAALDGFLALTIPFAVREAVRNISRPRLIVAWSALALAGYACLVTFSRGVYAAVPAGLVILAFLVHRQRQRIGSGFSPSVFAWSLGFAALVAVGGFFVFRAGGYRAMLAMLLLLAMSIPAQEAMRRATASTWLVAVPAAVLLAAIGILVGGVLPKGPYLVFAAALVATTAASYLSTHDRPGIAPKLVDTALVAGWLWLAAAAAAVAGHWGGPRALVDGAVVVGLLIAITVGLSQLRQSPWPAQPHQQLAALGFAALVMGSIAVFGGGAYMGSRFQTSQSDLDYRLAHWREGIGRLHGIADWAFGKGFGRFPATSLFESPDAMTPGGYRVQQRDGERFLAVAAPRIAYLNWGELFRVSQRVTVQPNRIYRLAMEVRSAQAGGLHVELCEKQLLYSAGCATVDPPIPAGLDGWRRIEVNLPSGQVGQHRAFLPVPVFFAIANGNANAAVEVRSIRLVGPDGVDVIANGDFSNRTAFWFSSSDKWHLPWHIKNIVLDVLFDQGLVGLGLFSLLVGSAFLRTAFGRAHRHPDAPFVAAAIGGFLVVGAFDSLLDVPRVAFPFYLMTMLGLMLRNPRVATPQQRPAAVAATAPTPPVQAAATVDEAAARARRRQQAFGTRVRR